VIATPPHRLSAFVSLAQPTRRWDATADKQQLYGRALRIVSFEKAGEGWLEGRALASARPSPSPLPAASSAPSADRYSGTLKGQPSLAECSPSVVIIVPKIHLTYLLVASERGLLGSGDSRITPLCPLSASTGTQRRCCTRGRRRLRRAIDQQIRGGVFRSPLRFARPMVLISAYPNRSEPSITFPFADRCQS
jgi:hypothetical protein